MIILTIHAMPVEILHVILELVPLTSLLSCLLVSKHLHRIIAMSSRLQYSIHLSKARLVEALLPSSIQHISYATRLNIHRQRERSWRLLNYSSRQSISLDRGSVYELKNNIYAHGRENDAGRTSSITFYDLPHASYSQVQEEKKIEPDSGMKNWSHLTEDIHIRDFTVDPSQDLLVLVTTPPAPSHSRFEINLRTLSSNVAHPLAVSSVLPCLPRLNPILNLGLGQGNLPHHAVNALQGLINNINHLLTQVNFPGNANPPPNFPGFPMPPGGQQGNGAPPIPLAPGAPPAAFQLPPQIPFNPNPPLGGAFGLAGAPLGAVRVQLLGDIIALMIQMSIGGTHFVIWNWKKGETMVGCSLTVLGGIDDFTLVSPDSFLGVTSTGKFELYKFELVSVESCLLPSQPPSPFIGPLPYFKARDVPVPDHLLAWKVRFPVLVARYSLPALNSGFSFSSLAMSSNPVMESSFSNPDESLTLDDVFPRHRSNPPFEPDNSTLSHSQRSGSLDTEHHSSTAALPIDMKFTRPSSRSRIFACGLFIVKHEPFDISIGFAHMAGQPGQAHVVTHFGPGNPAPPLAAPAQPAPVDPEQNDLEGETLPPLIDPDEEDEEPLLHSFVFFSDLGAFLQDLERFEEEDRARDVSPSSTSDETPDDSIFDVTMPFDLLSRMPMYTTPTESLPDDSPEKAGRIARDRLRRRFRSRTGVIRPREIRWKDWGPKNTRWFNEYQSQDWQHAVHGMRSLESVIRINDKLLKGPRKSRRPLGPLQDGADEVDPLDDFLGIHHAGHIHSRELKVPKALVLRDFNPYSCANPGFYLNDESTESDSKGKARDTGATRQVKWQLPKLVTEPSILDGCGAFRDEVVSCLPYTETVSDEDFEASTAMLDDEHILLLQRDRVGQVSGLDILTF